jgi:hypothetical protein
VESKQTNAGVVFGSLVSLAMMAAIVYGLVRWLGGEPGQFRDWLVGLAVLWWLTLIVILPWNLYFSTRAILHDAQRSAKQGLQVVAADMRYVERWARWSLVLALSLHLVTALGLALLQYYGISGLGYWASAAALLLMAFRPAGRAYDYLAQRLNHIGREVRFPRNDVRAVEGRMDQLEQQLRQLLESCDLENSESWAGQVAAALQTQATEQEQLRQQLEDLRRLNDDAHQQLAREAQAAASQVAEDGKVLNHVRELVRFFKEA